MQAWPASHVVNRFRDHPQSAVSEQVHVLVHQPRTTTSAARSTSRPGRSSPAAGELAHRGGAGRPAAVDGCRRAAAGPRVVPTCCGSRRTAAPRAHRMDGPGGGEAGDRVGGGLGVAGDELPVARPRRPGRRRRRSPDPARRRAARTSCRTGCRRSAPRRRPDRAIASIEVSAYPCSRNRSRAAVSTRDELRCDRARRPSTPGEAAQIWVTLAVTARPRRSSSR